MNTNVTTTSAHGQGKGSGNKNIQVVIRLVIFVAILVALWGFVSGQWNQAMPWIFLGVWAIVGGLVPALVVPLDQAMEEERTQIKEGVQEWDKPIVIVGSLYIPLGLVLVAALDARFGWSPLVPLWLQIVALIIGALGYLLGVWASAVNKFYGRFVRIQEERGHTVITGGPYRYVRHPGYAGVTLFVISSALALNSWWALVPNGLVALSMIVRTALEDKFLRENLEGYKAYARHTRYRLLPGIW